MSQPAPAVAARQRQRFLQGNEAVVEAALKADIGFFASYPITPANEISQILSEKMPRRGKIFIQMEDEISTLAAVVGASLGGMKAATATSGPGFSLMQEHIGYAVMAEIPCVIINVQRLGPSTGKPTAPSQGDVMQSRWGTHGDHPIIVLCPGSVAETYSLTIHSFNMAEKYRTPVILLMDEVIAHIREKAELVESEPVISRAQPEAPPDKYLAYGEASGDVPPLASYGKGYRYHVTGLYHDSFGLPAVDPAIIKSQVDRLFRKINSNLEDIIRVKAENLEDSEIVLISYGASVRSARHAMKAARAKGIKAGLLQLLTLFPFPENRVIEASKSAGRVIVVEMNCGQLKMEVERTLAGKCRVEGVHRWDGEMIKPEQILEKMGSHD